MTASVLLADPDVDTRMLYSDAFAAAGWTCLEAGDGREALVQALTQQPSLCVAELWLPNIDGMALCREIRSDAQTEHLPILIVTGESRTEYLASAMNAGATSVLVKPAPLDTIVQTAAELIESSRTLREHVEASRRALAAERRKSEEVRLDARTLITRSRARAYRRYSTTTPDSPSPALSCSRCGSPLAFETAYYGGVNVGMSERWDFLRCTTCRTRYEYRFRTRSLRAIGG